MDYLSKFCFTNEHVISRVFLFNPLCEIGVVCYSLGISGYADHIFEPFIRAKLFGFSFSGDLHKEFISLSTERSRSETKHADTETSRYAGNELHSRRKKDR